MTGQNHHRDNRRHLDKRQGNKAYLAGDVVPFPTLFPIRPGEYGAGDHDARQGGGEIHGLPAQPAWPLLVPLNLAARFSIGLDRAVERVQFLAAGRAGAPKNSGHFLGLINLVGLQV